MQLNLLDSVIFKKIVTISKQVNDKLNQKGIAIPVQNDNGTISVGHYTIVKEEDLFSIKDYRNETVISKINLPQTAILLANNLALGKFIDWQLVEKDKRYGYAVFEEKRYSTRFKRKNLDRSAVYEAKLFDAKIKKDMHKRDIIDRFKKFERIYK